MQFRWAVCLDSTRTIRQALLWAYDIKLHQLVNLPRWVDERDAYYDIEAVAGRNVTQAECRQMVQALLADRFQLVVSRPMQEIDVMALAKAPNGWTMAQLVEALSTFASVGFNKPLVDRTGLDGVYKIAMEFSLRFPGVPNDGSPDLIDALERLGLRVEERKEPFQMLRIERIERPSAN